MQALEKAVGPQGRAILVRTGQALVGLLFLVSGVNKLTRFSAVAGAIGSKGLPLPDIVLAGVIAIEILCGLALIANRQAARAAAVLALFVVAATVLFHPFWAADAAALQNQLNHFLKNVAILGALFALAGAARRA